MPDESRWSKAHDEFADIGDFMEENTDTIPISMLDVEKKTLPVISIKLEVRNSKSDVSRVATTSLTRNKLESENHNSKINA